MPRFTWSNTFPDNPDAEDKTASIEGYPRAYIRIFNTAGQNPNGNNWCWSVAAEAAIATGWEADGRTASTKAIAAWDAYLARKRRNVT